MTTKFQVRVTQTVEVTLDETKFTHEWLEEFRKSFYQIDGLQGHAEHIAQLEARGVYGLGIAPSTFIEGYGHAKDMGITASVVDSEIETDHWEKVE